MSTIEFVREYVKAKPHGAFLRPSDIPRPRTAVLMALSRITKENGPLVRVLPGLYWKGVESRFGKGSPSLIESALATAGLGAGPAEWSALMYLGLTTQVPAVVHISVLGGQKVIPGARVSKRNNLNRTKLNPIEIAIIETLRGDWFLRIDGGENALKNTVNKLAKDGSVNIGRISSVISSERAPIVRERWSTVSAFNHA
ncbi:MAG: hypothetical protein Q8K86_06670 [Candidatus Nanopelagicaceae bacterium]|nr:hypothetical protein [Candidatus Nanopelagicaceae bacterium]